MFNKDIISLHKQNGEIIENIRSTVQPDMIFVDDSKVLIEEGDHFVRKLSNGLTETYIVLDRGFYEKSPGFKAHYQCKVKKTTSRELEQNSHTYYNVQGNNAKININTTDNSNNVVNVSPENLFNEIRKTINEGILNREERRIILDATDELEEAQNTSGFIEKYQRFIGLATSHMELVTPFIPALTQLLT